MIRTEQNRQKRECLCYFFIDRFRFDSSSRAHLRDSFTHTIAQHTQAHTHTHTHTYTQPSHECVKHTRSVCICERCEERRFRQKRTERDPWISRDSLLFSDDFSYLLLRIFKFHVSHGEIKGAFNRRTLDFLWVTRATQASFFFDEWKPRLYASFSSKEFLLALKKRKK